MSEKTYFQKILDTKNLNYKLPSIRNFNQYFKYIFVFFIFGTFTFLTRDQYNLFKNDNIIRSTSEQKVISYNCSDYHRLIKQKRKV